MSKYIIKNCPCRMELHENDCFGHTGYYNCCACTDCLLKRIVKQAGYCLCPEILELLDIEECE